MTATKTRKAPAKSPIIRHCEFVPGGFHYFEMESSNRALKHVQEVYIESGMVRCSCEHFTFKLTPSEPTLGTPELHCKHISSAVEWLLNNSCLEVEDLQLAALLHEFCPCDRCFMPDANMPLCDAKGHSIEGFLCRECFNELRLTNKHWSPHAQSLRTQITELETRRDVLKADLEMLPDLQTVPIELAKIHEQLMGVWSQYLACEVVR
ncbi:hypothetical protein IAD21_00610 [Abditibacteriota bacterium]|nr:hypothetical protein IAD21_00610 [Abditibacteriota bacterium]